MLKNFFISYSKNGFTLAEVLITLVIIGVIAALTIPTVINNTKKQEYVSRLKKAYSTLAQATNKIIAEEGNPKASIGGWCNSRESMSDMYKKHMQNIQECGSGSGCFENITYRGLNGSDAGAGWNLDTAHSSISKKFILADGTQVLFIYYGDNESCGGNNWGAQDACGYIFVDINGSKGPNTIARDLFFLELREDGLYPTGCERGSCSGVYAYACTCKVLRESAMNY